MHTIAARQVPVYF